MDVLSDAIIHVCIRQNSEASGQLLYSRIYNAPRRAAVKATSSGMLRSVSAPDLAIILLAEVAAEHDEDFRVHLPVLLHAVVATLAGSPEPTVRAHCRQLLANLAHALAARPLGAPDVHWRSTE